MAAFAPSLTISKKWLVILIILAVIVILGPYCLCAMNLSGENYDAAETFLNLCLIKFDGLRNPVYLEQASGCLVDVYWASDLAEADASLAGALEYLEKCNDSDMAEYTASAVVALRDRDIAGVTESYARLMALDAKDTDMQAELGDYLYMWYSYLMTETADADSFCAMLEGGVELLHIRAASGLYTDDAQDLTAALVEESRNCHGVEDTLGVVVYEGEDAEASLNEVLSWCGTGVTTDSPDKILFLVISHPYAADRICYMDDGMMMLLPEALCPGDLSEVTHVVVQCYDYETAGSYTNGNVAVEETCQVLVYETAGGTCLYTSEVVNGMIAPSYTHGSTNGFVTGGYAYPMEVMEEALTEVFPDLG